MQAYSYHAFSTYYRIDRENNGYKVEGKNGLDQNIWALEALKGKMVISRDYVEFLESLEWLQGRGGNDRGSCEVCECFRDFGGFLECLEWFRTYL
jgi:hypothetical protein